jgi:hypothetical protein
MMSGTHPADSQRATRGLNWLPVTAVAGNRQRGHQMRVGMLLHYAGGFSETVTELADFERAGLQIAFVPEAYSFDAVSQLGFIAARTTTLETQEPRR